MSQIMSTQSDKNQQYIARHCAQREMCYGCCNCEPQYWMEHFPHVYNAFKERTNAKSSSLFEMEYSN